MVLIKNLSDPFSDYSLILFEHKEFSYTLPNHYPLHINGFRLYTIRDRLIWY